MGRRSGLLAVVVALLLLLAPGASTGQPTASYDYVEALSKSLFFYDAQRSGDLPATCPGASQPGAWAVKTLACNRVAWRGDSAVEDVRVFGTDALLDLSGGFYDAGDALKRSFPLSFALSQMALGVLEFKRGYADAGEYPRVLDTLKWGYDWLLKAWYKPGVDDSAFVVQVGQSAGADDGSAWLKPEDPLLRAQDRPAFHINSTQKGTDAWASAAAAFAAGSKVFSDSGDAGYAARLLDAARRLYAVARTPPFKNYHRWLPASEFGIYESYDFFDDLAWAASMLHYATSEPTYLADARSWHTKYAEEGWLGWVSGRARQRLLRHDI